MKIIALKENDPEIINSEQLKQRKGTALYGMMGERPWIKGYVK